MLGSSVGLRLGKSDGDAVGDELGKSDGDTVGELLGTAVVGFPLGLSLGGNEGLALVVGGAVVGGGVGGGVGHKETVGGNVGADVEGADCGLSPAKSNVRGRHRYYLIIKINKDVHLSRVRLSVIELVNSSASHR